MVFGYTDPVVLFDKIDQRWIIGAASGSHYCLAISTSSDATGSYDAYDIPFGPDVDFIDYAKLAIWADGSSWSSLGRYAGVYFFANLIGSTTADTAMCGFPLGEVSSPSSSLKWVCASLGPAIPDLLPADLEGNPGASGTSLPAPLGTPEYYVTLGATTASTTLYIYSFAPDFSSGTAIVSTVATPSVAARQMACPCIPQLATSQALDALGGYLMYRLSYRNFGTGESMVVNESVQASSAGAQSGVRWYQLTNTTPGVSGGWTVGQQGTFAPSDGTYRWMGSIAQDKFGDLGLGYSTSSASTYPGIAYTGQTPSDPPNTLEGEYQALVGPAAQIATPRWGDYSSMSVDPTDDCTFWYVNEYVNSSLPSTQLGTHIVAFRLGDCEQIPFSSFSTKLAITAGPRPGFQMYANFTLGAGGSINPLTQPVALQVGSYSVTVPPGSFKQLGQGSKDGNYVYSGTINGVSLQVHIVALGNSGYVFKAAAQPVNLTGLSNPVSVTITIGNNSGTAEAAAELERRPASGFLNGGLGLGR